MLIFGALMLQPIIIEAKDTGKNLEMLTRNSSEFIVFTFITVMLTSMFSTAVVASPRSYTSQAEQVQAAYLALLGDMERKPAILKASFSKNSAKTKLRKASFSPKANRAYNNSLRVTATAYTSHANQTDSTPNIAAWGDRLHSGMKVIAVSRYLLKVYGLKHKQKVRIKGLEGEYLVLDKMNKRWRKKIDIYMGMNKRKAFKWGRRKVEIYWNS